MGTHLIKATSNDGRIILDAFRSIVRNLRVSSRDCEAKTGLSSAQIFILQQLKKSEFQTVNEIADQTFTHQSTVSEIITRLVKKKLVSRRTSAIDARCLNISLTSLGRTALKSTPRTAQQDLADAIGKMKLKNRKLLADLLNKLSVEAGFTGSKPPLFFEDSQTQTTHRKSKKND